MTVVSGFDLLGGGIKRIQSGMTVFVTNQITKEIVIEDVVTKNSIILVYYGDNRNPAYSCFRAEIINAQTIKITRHANTGTTTTGNEVEVFWQVIEFTNVKRKQSGTVSVSNLTQDLSIEQIDISKSILFYNFTHDTTNVNNAYLATRTWAYLLNESTIRFKTWYLSPIINWQIIEF